jgi:hypothetical protein
MIQEQGLLINTKETSLYKYFLNGSCKESIR